MEHRNNRDEMVIATKFTTNYKTYAYNSPSTTHNATNYGGNSSKSLHLSLRDSLSKLRTSYIDILYVHWWDYTTSIEELMQSLDTVVKSRQVLYLGVSDVPAWIVSKANQYARDHGLAQFVIYQGLWSIINRDFERDIIPMCKSEGMAIAPWGSIGRGKFQSRKQMEERRKSGEGLRGMGGNEQTPEQIKISEALEKVSNELTPAGNEPYSVTAIALAYVLQRTPYVFPIIGGRRVSHLLSNIESLSINLSQSQIRYLECVVGFDVGFPMNFIGEDPRRSGETQGFLMKNSVRMKWVREEGVVGGWVVDGGEVRAAPAAAAGGKESMSMSAGGSTTTGGKTEGKGKESEGSGNGSMSMMKTEGEESEMKSEGNGNGKMEAGTGTAM